MATALHGKRTLGEARQQQAERDLLRVGRLEDTGRPDLRLLLRPETRIKCRVLWRVLREHAPWKDGRESRALNRY